jgi:Flp pilus assembly protein TadB
VVLVVEERQKVLLIILLLRVVAMVVIVIHFSMVLMAVHGPVMEVDMEVLDQVTMELEEVEDFLLMVVKAVKII